MKNQKIAELWTLIVCLNTVRYCIRQMSKSTNKNSHTGKIMKQLFLWSGKFLNMGQRHASKEDKELLSNLSHENVAAIAETVAIISAIPPDSIDWFCDRVNHIAKGIILNPENQDENEK